MNITILYCTISSITYILKSPSTPPITEQFLIYTRRNIYVIAIENEDPDLATTAVRIIQDKKKALDPPP